MPRARTTKVSPVPTGSAPTGPNESPNISHGLEESAEDSVDTGEAVEELTEAEAKRATMDAYDRAWEAAIVEADAQEDFHHQDSEEKRRLDLELPDKDSMEVDQEEILLHDESIEELEKAAAYLEQQIKAKKAKKAKKLLKLQKEATSPDVAGPSVVATTSVPVPPATQQKEQHEYMRLANEAVQQQQMQMLRISSKMPRLHRADRWETLRDFIFDINQQIAGLKGDAEKINRYMDEKALIDL